MRREQLTLLSQTLGFPQVHVGNPLQRPLTHTLFQDYLQGSSFASVQGIATRCRGSGSLFCYAGLDSLSKVCDRP